METGKPKELPAAIYSCDSPARVVAGGGFGQYKRRHVASKGEFKHSWAEKNKQSNDSLDVETGREISYTLCQDPKELGVRFSWPAEFLWFSHVPNLPHKICTTAIQHLKGHTTRPLTQNSCGNTFPWRVKRKWPYLEENIILWLSS